MVAFSQAPLNAYDANPILAEYVMRIIQRLRSGKLSSSEMIVFMQQARRIAPDDAEYANSILPDAGHYLDSPWIDWLISGKYTDDLYLKEIVRQKSFFARLSELYPHFLGFFTIAEDERIVNHARCVSDCFNDTGVGDGRWRKDKLDRIIRSNLDNAIDHANELSKCIDTIEKYIYINISDVLIEERHLNFERREVWDFSNYEFKKIIDSLRDLFQLHRSALSRTPSMFRSDTRSLKSCVVEYAYQMCDFWDGPPLLTTPGSAFSDLCSILYEIVTAQKDASLAGTINRFAKSKSRRQWDTDRIEDDHHEELQIRDNFYYKRKRTLEIHKVGRFYLDQAGIDDLPESARGLALRLAEFYANEIQDAVAELGPHPLPIFGAPDLDPGWWAEFQAGVSKQKALKREVGELRRALRSTGNPD